MLIRTPSSSMDIRRVTSSVGNNSKSMERAKEFCILLMNDDSTSHDIVAYILQNCINSEVLNFQRAADALNAIRERKDRLEVVLSNVPRSDTNRLGIIQHIKKEFKLRTILMSPDVNARILPRRVSGGTTVCFLKSLSMIDTNRIRRIALTREKDEMLGAELAGNAQSASAHENLSIRVEENSGYQKRKRKEKVISGEHNERSRDGSPMEKKPRVVWDREMHRKFLEAIEHIGYDKAFPKKIVEVMDVPGLTRENVASHLQKHRMGLKRAQQGYMDTFYGTDLINEVKEPCFRPGSVPINFHYGRQSEQGLRGRISVPSSSVDYCRFINPKASTSIPKLGQVPINHNFRVYGDQTKNILFSIENSKPLFKHNANQPAISNASTSFIGFRLASDGKMEFGQTRKNEIRSRESEFSTAWSTSGYEDFLHYPFTFGNGSEIPLQQPSVLPLQYGNGNPNQFPSTFVDFFPQQQSSQPSLDPNGLDILLQSCSFPLLGTNGNEHCDQYISTSISSLGTNVDEIPLQQPSFPPLEANGDQNPGHCPSTSISSLGISMNEIPLQPSSLPALEAFGNENSSVYPSTSIDSFLQPQQSSLPMNSADDNPDKCPSVSIDCFPHQETSLPLLVTDINENSVPPWLPLPSEVSNFGVEAGDLDVLLGSTSPQTFWDGDFVDTLFNHAD